MPENKHRSTPVLDFIRGLVDLPDDKAVSMIAHVEFFFEIVADNLGLSPGQIFNLAILHAWLNDRDNCLALGVLVLALENNNAEAALLEGFPTELRAQYDALLKAKLN